MMPGHADPPLVHIGERATARLGRQRFRETTENAMRGMETAADILCLLEMVFFAYIYIYICICIYIFFSDGVFEGCLCHHV